MKSVQPSVLILGATSAIAKATAVAFAAKGYRLYLASRNKEELARIATDLQIRYSATVAWGEFDAEQIESHAVFFETVIEQIQGLTGVVLAFGDLGDHDRAIQDPAYAVQIIQRNFIGAVSILTYYANYFARQQSGFIIGITSVAGDRGRQSNYIYGAAKGGLSLYLQGLRNRLFASGVRVITVKPGFVDTGMTFGMPGLFLVASPDNIGAQIVRALDKKPDIVYLPWFWRYIMLIIRAIPEAIFKRLKL